MRLLKRSPDGSIRLETFNNGPLPRYAILSHTWIDGQEVTYDELVTGMGRSKSGYAKISFCVDRAAEDGLDYSWVDTCCIDKSKINEVSTAINSMWKWYKGAAKCYVYLSDVVIPAEVDAQTYPIIWTEAFRRSRWFTRGWTLQELLAPPLVEFFSAEGKILGSRISLEQDIHEITKIPVNVLRGQRLSDFSVDDRMGWAAKRTTTIEEDEVYCLLGIFGVFLPLLYGEGEEYARGRLKAEIQIRQEGRGTEKLQDLKSTFLELSDIRQDEDEQVLVTEDNDTRMKQQRTITSTNAIGEALKSEEKYKDREAVKARQTPAKKESVTEPTDPDTDDFEAEEAVIIALDFGTTFSGISYCFTKQGNAKVATVVNWPGMDGEFHNAPKIPTVIRYDKRGNITWGAAVNPNADNIVGVKLLLDPHQAKPLYLPTGNWKNDLKKLRKAPHEVAADFIKAIYEYALKVISAQVPQSYMSLCKKKFVLSVPAVWSDTAKDRTLQAAKIAGLYPITLIKEPEAAALYTLYDLGFSLRVGDTFVVCDAGGGTVDLISYEVEALPPPRMKLKEVVPGSGGMAGSLGLNKRFEEAVRNIIGDEQFLRIKKEKAWLRANTQFDREIKPAFRGKRTEEYFVNFPMADLDDDPYYKLESNCWAMDGNDVKEIFAPLVTDIIRMINDQVNQVRLRRPDKGVTGIFLVGGFGSSQYLKSCVQHEHPDIQVLQPADAWAAIVKGAALSKLPKTAFISSRKATRHYGVLSRAVYEEDRDRGEKTYIDRSGITTRVEKFTWYISIGHDFQHGRAIKFPYTRSIEKDYSPEDLVFYDSLWESKDKIAPIHQSKGNDIKVNCTLKTDLRNIDTSHLKEKIDVHGEAYYDVEHDLVIKMESALMIFALEVGGKTMGSVVAEYRT